MRIYYVSQPEAKDLRPNKFYSLEDCLEIAKEHAGHRDRALRIKVNSDGMVYKVGTMLPDGTFVKVGEETKILTAVIAELEEQGKKELAKELSGFVAEMTE